MWDKGSEIGECRGMRWTGDVEGMSRGWGEKAYLQERSRLQNECGKGRGYQIQLLLNLSYPMSTPCGSLVGGRSVLRWLCQMCRLDEYLWCAYHICGEAFHLRTTLHSFPPTLKKLDNLFTISKRRRDKMKGERRREEGEKEIRRKEVAYFELKHNVLGNTAQPRQVSTCAWWLRETRSSSLAIVLLMLLSLRTSYKPCAPSEPKKVRLFPEWKWSDEIQMKNARLVTPVPWGPSFVSKPTSLRQIS